MSVVGDVMVCELCACMCVSVCECLCVVYVRVMTRTSWFVSVFVEVVVW